MPEHRKTTSWTDAKVLLLAIFVALAFGLLAGRSEMQQSAIIEQNHRMALFQYHECMVRNDAANRLNTILDQSIEETRAAPPSRLSAAEKAKNIQYLTKAKAGLVDCGEKP